LVAALLGSVLTLAPGACVSDDPTSGEAPASAGSENVELPTQMDLQSPPPADAGAASDAGGFTRADIAVRADSGLEDGRVVFGSSSQVTRQAGERMAR
jgi:hypothetical protein